VELLCRVASAHTLPIIFVVDDDEESRDLIASLLQRANVQNPVRCFRDGEEFVAYLTETMKLARGALAPGLVLLDVKMPKLSGFDVLAWLRGQEALRNLIVVMLSSSDEADDVERAQQMGAHTYLIKYPLPETLGALVRLAGQTVSAG
jgi:CheY-like chemotaxis protein